MTELKVKFTKGFAKRATAVAMALCMGLSLVPSGLVANAATWEEKENGWRWKGTLSVPTTSKEVEEGKSVELTAGIVESEAVTPVTPTATATTPTTPTAVPDIEWTSSNTAIATVKASDHGTKATVSGVKAGTATITVAVGSDTKTVTITVKPVTTPGGNDNPNPNPGGNDTPNPGGNDNPNPNPGGNTNPDTPKPTVVKVSKVALTLNGQTVTNKKLNVQTGKKYTLKAAISPSKATNKKVKWSTSSKKLATVTQKGVVTINKKKTGTVKITATAQDGSKKKATVSLKIGKKAIAVSKVTIKGKKTMSLKKSKTQTLKVTVSPATVSNQKVTWKSSNKKIATVSTKGKVTAKKRGTVTITATSKANKKKIAKIKIKVNK